MKFVDKYHSSISHLVKMRTAVKSSFWYLPEGRYMEKSSALVFLGENPSLPINSTEPMICALELHWEQSLSKRQVLADTVPEWKLTQVLTSLSERKKTLLLSKMGGGGRKKFAKKQSSFFSSEVPWFLSITLKVASYPFSSESNVPGIPVVLACTFLL